MILMMKTIIMLTLKQINDDDGIYDDIDNDDIDTDDTDDDDDDKDG